MLKEGGRSPKEGGKLFTKGGEPIGQGKDGAVHRGREDASCLSREGGCQPFVERGRMPAKAVRQGRGAHQPREGWGRSLRKGRCQPFIESSVCRFSPMDRKNP